MTQQNLTQRIQTLSDNTFHSLSQQNIVIEQLHREMLDNRESIKLLSTEILKTNKKLDSLKTYLDNDIKKDIDLIISTKIKELEDKLDLKKSAKPMGDDARSMYTGGFKKTRKTKHRKRKGTRKKS